MMLLDNFLNPPILFFFLGILATCLHSNLEIPQPLPKLFSLYLLLAIGLHGGMELGVQGIHMESIRALGAGVLLATLIPIASFFILKRKLDLYNAAAMAAAYGSVSAVTFITATSFLKQMGIPYGGHMIATLALMESPAILIAILLFRVSKKEEDISWIHLLKDALFNGSVMLLMGSFFIGFLLKEGDRAALKPFTDGIFKGMLCFFLLDMGMITAKRLGDLKKAGIFLISFALFMPLVSGIAASGLAWALNLGQGDAFLLTMLAASASYIAVPAAMRITLPEANPGLYVSLPLGFTFPLSVIVGIPLFNSLIEWIYR